MKILEDNYLKKDVSIPLWDGRVGERILRVLSRNEN